MNYNKVLAFEAIPFLSIVVLDQATKVWSFHLSTSYQWGPLHIQSVFNHGVFLGFLETIPDSTKIVVLGTLGALVFCAYLFTRILVPMHSSLLKAGMAMVTAGILGNVLDRMVGHGGVTDFIFLRFSGWSSPVWNLADMFQVWGYGMVFRGVYQDSKLYWQHKEHRKHFWVDPPYQIKFCLNFIVVAFSMGLVTAVMSYAFLKTTLDAFVVDPHKANSILKSFVIALVSLQTCLLLGVAFIARYFSAKVAGPMYAIKRFLRELVQGKKGAFKLRSYDDFKDIEPLLNEVASKMEEELPSNVVQLERKSKDQAA